MKFIFYLFLIFQLFFFSFSTNQNLLSNQEIKEILKCFGDLDLEEGCVICRYVTQKIYKVLDISAMCPDVVDTKLLTQRQREWKPDPKTINKWTVLFNLQKDYMERIKPEIENVKNYDKQIHERLLKEKIEKENLANLIQFQNKVNSDLAHTSNPYSNEFNKDHCDDEDLKYKHLQVIAPQTGIINNPKQTMIKNNKLIKGPSNSINNYNNIFQGTNPFNKSNKKLESSNTNMLKKKMMEFMKSSKSNPSKITSDKTIDYLNKEILKQKMAQFFVQPTSSNYEILHDDIHHIHMHDPHLIVHHEIPSKVNYNYFKFKEKINENPINNLNNFENMPFQNNNVFKNIQSPPSKENPFKAYYLNGNEYDKNLIPQMNFDFIPKGMEGNENIKYLGSSIGNPYAGFNTSQMENKISHYVNKMTHKRKKNKNHVNRKEIERIKHRIIRTTKKLDEAKNKQNIQQINNYNNNVNMNKVKNVNMNKVNNIKNTSIETKKNLQRNTSFKQVNAPSINYNNKKISRISNLNTDEIINREEEISLNNKIANPPSFDSFIQTKEDVHFDKNFFTNLIEKSKNFNLETQRRGRRRSRFPDPQWDCAEMQVSKIVRYLCEEELSSSYQKYCKPIFEQINTMIESFLYHDNNLEICQNLHMCPVTIDIHNDHFNE